MAELLFVATIIFVAYVVFVAIGDNKSGGEIAKTKESVTPETAKAPVPQPEKVSSPESVAVKAEAKPATVSVAEKPAAKPARAKAAPAKPAAGKAGRAKALTETPPASTAPVATVDSLKNPKTGEVAKVPGNYAFAKRWIKDALVEEGLLDKVYKNNELDAEATAKIQSALDQLKAMPKYQ